MNEPIIIAGCPRSGTTILRDILSTHPNIFILNEAQIIGGNPIKRLKKMKESMWEYHEIPSPPRFDEQEVETFEQLSDITGCDNVGDKAPMYYLKTMNKVKKEYPDSKIIVCMRDGRSIIDSQFRHYYNEHKRWWTAGKVEDAESLWLDALRHYESWDYDHLVVRYEQVCKNKHKVYQDVMNHIDCTYEPIKENVERLVKPTHYEGWKQRLPDIMDELSDEFKMKLKEYNYE